MYIEDTICRSK